MRFAIKHLEFDIAGADLQCTIPDPHWTDTYGDGRPVKPSWALSCRAVAKDIAGHAWAPHAYHDRLALAVRDWRAIAGTSITWDEPFDAGTGEPNGGFSVFEHEGIRDAALRFLGVRGDLVTFEWKGHCDLRFSEELDTGVPFRIEGAARFEGLLVNGTERDDLAAFRARAGAHFDLAGYEEGVIERGPARYEDGVEMARCLFRPRRQAGR